ncbi:MAG: hypothetical protein U1F83_16470 [Verrucomicrobiota bacterium]
MPRFNLESPNSLSQKCDIENLTTWALNEAKVISDLAVRDCVTDVCKSLDVFVRWPTKAVLLWSGCDRIAPPGARQRIHTFPNIIKDAAKRVKAPLDTRSNGPAIVSFLVAGGTRPTRFGSHNSWSVHHIYSGKFPYLGRSNTLHAAKEGLHFTQSAGLIAVHPIADGICDEYPFFSWLLRAEAFRRFGYDPDGVFRDSPPDQFGFAANHTTEVICSGEDERILQAGTMR